MDTRHYTHVEFGAFPLQLDVKHFEHFPHLPTRQISLGFQLVCFDLYWAFRSKYLDARSQSNRKQHEQTGLLEQMEENQQSTETTPQNYKQREGHGGTVRPAEL